MLQPELDPEKLTHQTVQRILSSIQRLRPLPTNVSRVLRALDDPDTTPLHVADLISLDQALTAYLIRVANSAYLGYTLPCSSVSEAVMRLGFKRVRELALSMAVSGPLTKRLFGYRLGDGALWSHSVAVASIAHWFAKSLSYPDPEEAYVAGLLHDMGKLLLDQYVRADYHRIIEIMWKKKWNLWQVEEHLFGLDHAAVGGLMASQWQFPTPLADAIRNHHAPSLANKHDELAALVNIANALSPVDKVALSSLDGQQIHPEALGILCLDETLLKRMCSNMREDFEEYEQRKPLAIYQSN